MTMGRVASHLAALLVVGVFLTISAAVWFPSSPPSPDHTLVADEGRQHVEENYAALIRQIDPEAAAATQFVQAQCRCRTGMQDWAMIEMTPAAVARIRRAVVLDAERAGTPVTRLTFIKSDDDLLRQNAVNRPVWWTPTKLADAEIVAIGELQGTVYVFSEKAGRIYAMSWTA